ASWPLQPCPCSPRKQTTTLQSPPAKQTAALPPAAHLPVRAARPAAGPPHALAHLVEPRFDPAPPRRLLLAGGDPADPFVARERRDVQPKRNRGRLGLDRLAKVRWQLMHRAAWKLLCLHD